MDKETEKQINAIWLALDELRAKIEEIETKMSQVREEYEKK